MKAPLGRAWYMRIPRALPVRIQTPYQLWTLPSPTWNTLPTLHIAITNIKHLANLAHCHHQHPTPCQPGTLPSPTSNTLPTWHIAIANIKHLANLAHCHHQHQTPCSHSPWHDQSNRLGITKKWSAFLTASTLPHCVSTGSRENSQDKLPLGAQPATWDRSGGCLPVHHQRFNQEDFTQLSILLLKSENG